MSWWLYILACRDGSLYTGIALDVDARLEVHRSGKGAKYLRGRGPLVEVVRRCVGDKGEALSLERQVKRLTRSKKQALIAAWQTENSTI